MIPCTKYWSLHGLDTPTLLIRRHNLTDTGIAPFLVTHQVDRFCEETDEKRAETEPSASQSGDSGAGRCGTSQSQLSVCPSESARTVAVA